MYFPVTSFCSEDEGTGTGNFHASGINALTALRFSVADSFQPIVAFSSVWWSCLKVRLRD